MSGAVSGPEPLRKIIGDLSDTDRVVVGLQLRPPEEARRNMTDDIRRSTAAFEQTLDAPGREAYLLRLYVAGVTPRSGEVLARIKAVCEEHLHGRYELEVIDIRQQPETAIGARIVVTPTLIKVLPPPLRRLVGDLLETEEVLRGLNLRRRE